MIGEILISRCQNNRYYRSMDFLVRLANGAYNYILFEGAPKSTIILAQVVLGVRIKGN